MGRTALITPLVPEMPDSPALTAMAAQAAALVPHSRQVLELVGDPLPYDRERSIATYLLCVGQAQELLIEAGKQVLLIREHEPREEFERIVGERLGLCRAAAFGLMSTTLRLLALPRKVVESTGRLERTKIIDLLAATDDSTLESLAEGGTVAGMTLDEVERMSTRELRAALREARENEQATGRLLEEKNHRIDELATRVTRAERKRIAEVAEATPDQVRQELMEELGRRTFRAEAEIRGSLRMAIEALMHHAETSGVSAEELISGALCQVERALREVRGLYLIKEVPTGDDRPEWVDLPWAKEGMS
jgi:hypothetical protein